MVISDTEIFKTWHNFGEFLYTTSCNFTRLSCTGTDIFVHKRYMTSTAVLCWIAVIILTCTLYLHLQKFTLCLHVD